MFKSSRGRRWTGWSKHRPSVLRPFPNLRIEELESRLAPATFTWSGNSVPFNPNWSTGANWVGGIAPLATAAEVDNLVFPAGVPAAKRIANNDLSPAVINSITIADSNYSLTQSAGKGITLGIAAGSGFITINASSPGNVLAIDTTLGVPGTTQQIVSVNNGSDLTVSGKLTGATGTTLTKQGAGILTLSADNTTFTGKVLVDSNSGTLVISNVNALGTFSGTADTTVLTGSTLAVSNVVGTIREPITLNGPGVSIFGALQAVAGTNTWAGAITLSTDSTIGASTGAVLRINSVISDAATLSNLTKEGQGEVQLNAANAYRGSTTVNDGILTVGNAGALGTAAGDAATGTVVRETQTKAGQLRLSSVAGFTVLNELLTLNGDGLVGATVNKNATQQPFGGDPYGLGALYNDQGNNTWAGPVILGSGTGTTLTPTDYVAIGGADSTDLIISGVVSQTATPGAATFLLEKVEPGRVILNNVNTYTGGTRIVEGILNIRDSKALGTGNVVVIEDGTLELEVEAATTTPQFGYGTPTGTPLATARDLGNDSVTGDVNKLQISNALSIAGLGHNNLGALHSLSGTNVYTGAITLSTLSLAGLATEAAIGVAQDARATHPRPNASYFTIDYSLTTTSAIAGPNGVDFVKRDFGHLILPVANTYTGITRIEQGWVTIQNNRSLGADRPGIGDTVQPHTVVSGEAAVHIKPLTQASPALVIPENITLTGDGPDHPYAFIGAKGALMNLGGNNTWSGDVSFAGPAGIGVEQTDASSPITSELTVTGSTLSAVTAQTYSFTASGDDLEFSQIIDTGSNSGTVTIDYDMISVPDRLEVYYPPRSQGGTAILDTGYVPGAAIVSVPFGPGPSTEIEIVMNEGGGSFGTFWFLNSVTVQTAGASSSLTKWGSKRLNLQGDGTYGGDTNIREGTLRAQNDTALGRLSSGTATSQESFTTSDTVVSDGAVLELQKGIATNNGGVAAGIEVWDEHLVLHASGQQVAVAGDPALATFKLTYTSPVDASTYTTISLPITATAQEVQDALNALPPLDPISPTAEIPGGVTVTRTGNVYFVQFGNARDRDVPPLKVLVAGGAEVQISGGNAALLNLSDDNVWRGPVTLAAGTRTNTAANSRLSILGAIDDDAVNNPTPSDFTKRGNGVLMLGGANSYRGITAIDEGIVTAMNSLAFGAADETAATGTIVSPSAQLQLQGSLTISGEALSVQGTGPNAASVPTSIPVRWLQVGSAPINGAQTPNSQPATGRVTGTVVDPSDTNVIYISTAGGGAWKTKNAGKTWLPLFDLANPNAPLYGGAIALDPGDPRIVYYGSGEANNSADSFSGTGVYRSTDSGRTWALLTGLAGPGFNPIAGRSVSRITVQAGGAIFVSTSDLQTHRVGAGAPGVWRYNGTTWFNLTAPTSIVRATQNGQLGAPPNTPGPDDDFRISFPQLFATWSDVQLVGGTLFAALGTSFGSAANAVYRCVNPFTNNPIWYIGNPGTQVDNRSSSEFPNGAGRNGRIQFSAAGATIYASIANPFTGGLLEIQKSSDGGVSWAKTNVTPPNYLGTQGWYDQTIVTLNANTVYVAGVGYGSNHVFLSTNGGTAAWTDITVDGVGNGPHVDSHAMALDSGGRLILGNDGGVWRFDPSNSTWNDLNGTLAITTFNGIAVHPTDFNVAYGGSQDNGTEKFTGSQPWTHSDFGDGGQVQVDPINPDNVYHVVQFGLLKSTNAGTTWNFIYSAGQFYFPFLVDPITPERVVVGENQIVESTDGGASFIDLNAPTSFTTSIALAQYQGNLPNGSYQPDPSYPSLTDQGSNHYDPDTIYITDGSSVYLTKNRGGTWVNRSFGLPAGGQIEHIAVDPANRDTAYITISNATGFGLNRVYKTTNAGVSWANIGGAALPDQPAWTIVVDPRDNSLYVGTDLGVFVARNGGTGGWTKFGAGMPNVQVKDLVLNQTLNTLSAGTYGRSMFQLFLDYAKADSGALRAVSGSSVWTGPVTLTANTTIDADGNNNIQNGIAFASLDIRGVISDAGDDVAAGNTFTITKIGGGTLTFTGVNTYGGQTLVREGVLQANNSQALGEFAPDTTANTIVTAGAALELRTDLFHEPITLNGNGIQFNGHFTGALRNVSNFNTYTGVLTLATNTTIGVDSNTQLTIGGVPTNVSAGIGSITDEANGLGFDKELPGTLVLASANVYGGVTRVVQGAIRVEDADALGDAGVGTFVLDGAQIQMARNPYKFVNDPDSPTDPTKYQTVVLSEPLYLSGTGIFGTGAIQNVRGDLLVGGTNDNAWQGPITFTRLDNFSPPTTAGLVIALGSSDSRDTLTLDTVLDQDTTALDYDVRKVGPGRVTLTKANLYQGLTTVAEGFLRILDNDALGTNGSDANGTVVLAGGTLELDGSLAPLSVPEYLTLNGDGVGNAGALNNVVLDNVYSAPITLASNASIGAVADTTLTIAGLLQDPVLVPVPAARLRKAGSGIVVLPDAKDYGGRTVVDGGILRINTPLALGNVRGEVQTIQVIALNGSFALSFRGQTTVELPFDVAANGGANPVDSVENALNALTTIGGAGGTVAVSSTAGTGSTTFTITFGGTLGNIDLPQIVPVTIVPISLATTRQGSISPAVTEQQTVRVFAGAGAFALTFNGDTTTALDFDVAASGGTQPSDSLQNALNALSTIAAAGGVTVTALGSSGDITYTITFNQPGDRPQIGSALISGGTLVLADTFLDGQGMTTVNSGATLQVEGSLNFDFPNELITLNGQGFFDGARNLGALNVKDGNAVWNVPLLLGSNASIGTLNAGDSIDFNGPISDTGGAFDLDIYAPSGTIRYQGDGTGLYAGTNYTLYTGTTTVHDGALLLDVTGAPGILGPLVVGDGVGGSALVQELQDNEVGNTSPVTVNSDGLFDLAGHQDTIGILTVNAGTVQTGVGGKLTTAGITMVDGLIDVGNNATLISSGAVNMSAGAQIVAGSNTTVSFGNLTMDASSISFGNPATFTAGNITMTGGSTIALPGGSMSVLDINLTGGSITVGDGAPLSAGNVTVAGGGSIALGDGNTFHAAGSVSVSGGSSITFDTMGVFNIDLDLLLDNSKLEMSTGGSITVRNVTMINTAHLNFATVPPTPVPADNGTITASGNFVMSGNSTLSFGNLGTATITGDFSQNAGTVSYGDRGSLSARNVTVTNGTVTFASINSGTITSTGLMTVTGGTVTFGARGVISATTGGVILDNSIASFGDNGRLTAAPADLTMRNGARLQYLQNGLLQVRDLTTTGSSNVSFGNTGTATVTRDVNMTGGSIAFANDGAFNVTGNVIDNGGAIRFGANGTLTAVGVTVTNGSLTFGTTGHLTQTGDLVLDNSTALLDAGTALNRSTVSVRNVSLSNASNLLFATPSVSPLPPVPAAFGKLTATGNLTMTGASNVVFGDNGEAAVTGSVNQTGGAITFGNTGKFTAGPVTTSNGNVTFGNSGEFTSSGPVSLTNGGFTFGTLGKFTDNGSLTLSKGTVVLGANGQMKALDVSTTGASKIQIGNNTTLGSISTLDTGAVTVGSGGSIVLGSSNKFTAGGTVSASGAGPISFDVNGNFAATGDLILNGATFSMLNNGTAKAKSATVSAGGKITFTDGGSLTLADATVPPVYGALNISGSTSKVSFGNAGVLTTGPVAENGGAISFGDAGNFTANGNVGVTGGAVTFTSTTTGTFVVNGTLTLQNAGTTGTTVTFGVGGNLTSDDLTLTASSIVFGIGGTESTRGRPVVMTGNSKIQFANNGTLTTGPVTNTGGAISFGSTGQFTAGGNDPVSITNGSLSFGITGKLTSGDLTLNNALLSFANNGKALVGDALVSAPGKIDMSNHSRITFLDNGKLTANGNLTDNLGTISFSNFGQMNVQNVSLTNDSISMGDNSTLTAGNITDTNGPITLGNISVFTAGAVSVTGAAVALGSGPLFTTTGDLSLASASLTLGASGGVGSATKNVTLNPGTILIAAGTTLAIAGDITADSNPVERSAITGGGTIDVGTVNRTIAVGNGNAVDNVDLQITTNIVTAAAPGVERFIKTGPGRLELAPLSGFTGSVDVTAGEVQVGTQVGPVRVTGGATLSGNGTVGTLTGVAAGVDGRIEPGINWQASNTGILTAGATILGPLTTFEVNLSNSAAPGALPHTATPGTDYDQLRTTGLIDLGGASLVGTYGPGILIGDTFTIIDAPAGGLTGAFAKTHGQDAVFFDGYKFSINYDYTNGDVILQKIRSDTSVTIATDPNPSTAGQPVNFTATVTIESGSVMYFPNVDTVTFSVDGNPLAPVNVQQVGPLIQAFFTTPLGFFATAGFHPVHAHFDGDPQNFNPSDSSPDVQQEVLVPSIDPIVGSPAVISPDNTSSQGTNDAYVIMTTIQDEQFLTQWTVTIKDASGAIVRTINGSGGGTGGTTVPISTSWDGKNDLGVYVSDLGIDNPYSVTVSFVDPFNNTGITPATTVIVDNTSPSASIPSITNSVVDPTAAGVVPTSTNVTGLVSDAHLDHWAVDFTGTSGVVRSINGTGPVVNATWDGKTSLGVPVASGSYTVTITAFDQGGNQTTSGPQTVVVLSTPATVTLLSSLQTTYGQNITLTAVVAAPAAAPAVLSSLLVGTPVTFFRGTIPLGNPVNVVFNAGLNRYEAVITVPTFAAATYTNLTARYAGNSTFVPSTSAAATHIVNRANVTVTALDRTKVYGDPVPQLTAAANAFTVTGLVNGDTVAVFSGSLGTTATQASPVIPAGYPITRGGLAPNSNYNIATFNPAILTVTKAPLQIVVDDAIRDFGKPNPSFTFSGQGLRLSDTASVVTGLNLATTARLDSPAGKYPITAAGTPTAQNYNVTGITPGTLSIIPAPTNIAVGTGAGTLAAVNVYTTDGQLTRTINPFGSFFGGVRTTSADFNKDGVLDYAVGTGPGVAAQISIFDGATGASLFAEFPFADFEGGVFVASGDINGDGIAELVVTPDEGGGPRIVVYQGGTFAPLLSYFGIADPNFRGGARAGVGDLNGDGLADIVVSAGFQGGPRISIWDGSSLAKFQFKNMMPDFFVFENTLRNGAYVAVGDVNGDGLADLIAGAGPGGAPRVKIISGKDLLSVGPGAAVPFANFFGGDVGNRGGVRVVAKSLDGDLFVDVVTGGGEGGGDTVTAYRGSSLASGAADPLYALDTFGGFNNGVFVG